MDPLLKNDAVGRSALFLAARSGNIDTFQHVMEAVKEAAKKAPGGRSPEVGPAVSSFYLMGRRVHHTKTSWRHHRTLSLIAGRRGLAYYIFGPFVDNTSGEKSTTLYSWSQRRCFGWQGLST